MGKRGLKVLAVVMAVVFGISMVVFPSQATAQQQAPSQAGAAAGKAGAEAGAATAAGVSTGTIVAGVLAAAAIAAIAAASGGGGEAVSVAPTPTPSGVASALASAGLSTDQLLALYDALETPIAGLTLKDILKDISYDDFKAALTELGIAALGKDDLKNYLNQLKTTNPDLYNRLIEVLKKLKDDPNLFAQAKAAVSDPQKLKEAIKQQVEKMLTQNHPGYTVQFTTVHHGGGIYTTTYHLIKQ